MTIAPHVGQVCYSEPRRWIAETGGGLSVTPL
jgi:hypothetical protein